jgi:hypothetical protein
MRCAIIAIVVAPLVAHADPELGAPLPSPTALPAMSVVSPLVVSAELSDVPVLPLAEGSVILGGISVRTYGGGAQLGMFGFYSLGTRMGFGDSVHMFDIELIAPGIGYRKRTWIVAAQLVPAIEWYADMMDREHLYTASIDVQACVQYNAFGFFPKNSAACVYVAPAIYRDGWFEGATFGVRWFPF